MINAAKIQSVARTLFPQSRVGEFIPFFEEVFDYASINTERRVAVFFGQIGIECKMFTDFEEDLWYRALTLTKTWPNRFRLPAKSENASVDIFSDGMRNALRYEKNPVKLANYVYAGRMGNRGEKFNDGYLFRGRGPKQITGASNYVLCQNSLRKIEKFKDLDLVKNPDALLDPELGLYASGWFWKGNHLNEEADQYDIVQATYIVNGGYNSLDKRKTLTNKALKLLS